MKEIKKRANRRDVAATDGVPPDLTSDNIHPWHGRRCGKIDVMLGMLGILVMPVLEVEVGGIGYKWDNFTYFSV